MTSNLRKISQELRAFAKRTKDFKYTEAALIIFLMTGMVFTSNNLFAAKKDSSIQNQVSQINTSINQIRTEFKQARKENDKLVKNTNLELIQLMEQGDHVVKSPWSSWQYGINYFNNNWNGVYKGRGDKKAKYPYEGIFERSLDIYERSISPDSSNYGLLGRNRRANFASGAASGYGIASVKPVKEPIIPFEVNASIRPRSINKSAITIAEKTAVTPTLPEAISFTPPSPVISVPALPELPSPPKFNIQLGSYCNSMAGCGSLSTNGGPYNSMYQTRARSISLGQNLNITSNDPSLRYGWADNSGGNSALLFSYFDATGGTIGGTSVLTGNLTVSSINPVKNDAGNTISYNKQDFLVGGSRVATLDNVAEATLENNATVNLVGPLTVGFEVQTDTLLKDNNNIDQKDRTIKNGASGIITDESEATNTDLQAIIPLNQERTYYLANFGTPSDPIKVKNKNGFFGYKVGMILTLENVDTHADSHYHLINNGKIKINGEKSIGLQIFAPTSPSKVEVFNSGNVFMGGIESYGMKWSSRVSNNSTMENTGTIEVKGDGTTTSPSGEEVVGNSLSSGIAVVEDKSYTGSNAIRAWNGKVKNNGIINVSGGKGNTGMVLIVAAPDDITNDTNGIINVSSTKGRNNIAMRVDKTTEAPTDDTTGNPPKAINNGTINLDGDSSIGMVGTNANVVNNKSKTIGTTSGKTIINGIGMATSGGNLENDGIIDLKGTGASSNTGVYMEKNDTTGNLPTGTLGENSTVKVKGDYSTGVLVKNGTLNYGGSTTALEMELED